jgi:hypothetical protein
MTADIPFRTLKLWRWRWLYRWEGRSTRMHRLVKMTAFNPEGSTGSEVPKRVRDYMVAEGTTACGLKGWFSMPGISGRLGAPRCPKCCDVIGIPRGDGAPYNVGVPEPGCVGNRRC